MLIAAKNDSLTMREETANIRTKKLGSRESFRAWVNNFTLHVQQLAFV